VGRGNEDAAAGRDHHEQEGAKNSENSRRHSSAVLSKSTVAGNSSPSSTRLRLACCGLASRTFWRLLIVGANLADPRGGRRAPGALVAFARIDSRLAAA